MKLGILTLHSAHNYGATLQAYGLKEYLRSKGHEAYVIDYRPDYITCTYPKYGGVLWKSYNVLHCLSGLFCYYVYRNIRLRRWSNFFRFYTEQLDLAPYTPGMDFHDYDAVLIGSDQVWSKAHTGGRYDPLYFGDGFKCKVIPYAPSCMTMEPNEDEERFLSEHLDAMTAISVREQKLSISMQSLTQKTIKVVVDPSLLAGRKIFEKITKAPNSCRPYILIYEINYHPEVYRMAKVLAKSINGDIIELVNGMRHFHRSSMREAASPEEFLGYIKHAACVLTTSFHGTAFSVIFHTPFYTVLQHTAADDRMVNLLRALDLTDRIVDMNDSPVILPLDADFVDTNLQILVKESEAYIDKALHEDKEM